MIPKVYVPMQKICHHKCSILPSFLQQIESQRFSVFYLLFLCLLHETWLSITFPEFLPENLRVKFCQWLKVLLWQPCCQDLVQLKNHKQSFCVYYFHFWNLESGSWQEHFSVFFFLFFINHQCYSNSFKRNQRMWISDKTANVTKYFFCSTFVLDWFIHVPGFITITYFILRK